MTSLQQSEPGLKVTVTVETLNQVTKESRPLAKKRKDKVSSDIMKKMKRNIRARTDGLPCRATSKSSATGRRLASRHSSSITLTKKKLTARLC